MKKFNGLKVVKIIMAALIFSLGIAIFNGGSNRAGSNTNNIEQVDLENDEINESVAVKDNVILDKQNLAETVIVEETKQGVINESILLSAGTYVVGEDIEAGKYDIVAVEGSGTLYYYKSLADYQDDEIWRDYLHLASKESREKNKYISEAYSNMCSNQRFVDGECIIIETGLTVEVTKK